MCLAVLSKLIYKERLNKINFFNFHHKNVGIKNFNLISCWVCRFFGKMVQMRSGDVTKVALRLMLLVICIGTTWLCWSFSRSPVALQHQDQSLLNLTNFHLISSPFACDPEVEVKAIVVITSHAGNVQGRMAWRNGLPTNVSQKIKYILNFQGKFKLQSYANIL